MNEKKQMEILESTDFFGGQTLLERMQYYHTPAISFAVINNGIIDCAYACGSKKYLSKDTVTTDTLFQAASISKEIFACGVLRLCEEKKMDLDTDIHNYLTDFSLPDLNGKRPIISLRQLLSHTGGLNVSGFDGYRQNVLLPSLLEILNGQSPANSQKVIAEEAAGKKFCYSGGGTTLAQKAVVDICDDTFPAIMRKYVLDPLKMMKSTYQQPLEKERIDEIAFGHTMNYQPVENGFAVMPEMAAAGLWTTPTELAQYGLHIQRIMRGNPGILRKETVDIMTMPQHPSSFKMENTTCQTGIGCFIKGADENVRFGHSGWNQGYVSLMNFYKYRDQGVVIMLNANEGEPLLYEIQEAISQVYGW